MDVTNKFIVSVRGDDVVLMAPPLEPFSKHDALVLAAWLVAIADPDPATPEFEKIFQAVLVT